MNDNATAGPSTRTFPDLDLKVSPRFERASWRVERIGWTLMALALTGSLCGLFGDSTVILRAASIYLFLLVVIRLAGRRTLSSLTVFDLILTLIISECVQNAIVGEDHSLIGGMLAVTTLVVLDIALSYAKEKVPSLECLIDGNATVLINDGVPEEYAMRKERIDRDDILEASREQHGLQRMNQIRYAILERSGKITIIPQPDESP